MKKEVIHEKNKQLTLSDRNSIWSCLQRGLSLTAIGDYIQCSPSTIKREIDKHKELRINGKFANKCGYKLDCTKQNMCGNSKCTKKCCECNYGKSCNSLCAMFDPRPDCKLLKKHCGVCNGCGNFRLCKLNKFIYEPNKAQLEYKEKISTAHVGKSITDKEAKELADFLIPLLHKNLSISAIKSLYPEKLYMTEQTLYNWVDEGFLPGIDNISLLRKVKYKPRNSKKYQKNDYEYLKGRFYEDFLAFVDNHKNDLIDTVEMDTVEGANHDSFILTLLFRKCNFMLSFKLIDHTSDSVVKVFDHIKETVGEEVFSRFFKVILTDRGCEFTDPLSIECSSDGKKLANVFYCDSRQSQQKGKLEKNHVELRKIFPKGTSFTEVSQQKLNIAINMVNSYPRESLNFSNPYDLFVVYAPKTILYLNDCKKISREKLDLSPRAIK